MERKFGPYTLIHQIAVGGMAEIHLARTDGIEGFEKYVAIKMIHPNFSEDAQFVQMLIDEAKITVQLTHVNIAQTFDLGRVGDTYYITMEYVEGCDLYKLLQVGAEQDIDVPTDVAAFVVKEALTGLDFAHRKRDMMGQPLGIVHRDVSPQNVLVSNVGEVKVIDFGIAKATMRAQETQAGVIKGKYYYMSPEQAWGETVDARTDIFSAGIILYELLTGQMLYLEEDLHLLLDMIRGAKIDPPSTLRPDIPPDLEAIVMRALKRDPNKRYRTAGEMAIDLERFLHKHSPVFNASKITAWTREVLGDHQALSPDEELPERDRAAVTQGLGPDQLIVTRDDFSDENSIIFRVQDVDERMRAAEAENDDDDDLGQVSERRIDQETGFVAPAQDPYAQLPERGVGDETRSLTDHLASPVSKRSDPSFSGDFAEENDERTVISGPPGFDPYADQSPDRPTRLPTAAERPEARRSGESHDSAAEEFDSEATLAHSPAAEAHTLIQDDPDPLEEATVDSEPTRALSNFNKRNPLSADNPEPAVSALKPAKKSRRTPARGVAAQDGGEGRNPNSVLSSLLTNSGGAQVALSENSHTPDAIPLPPGHNSPIPIQPQGQQSGHPPPYPPQGQQSSPPYPYPPQGYPAHQPPYPQQGNAGHQNSSQYPYPQAGYPQPGHPYPQGHQGGQGPYSQQPYPGQNYSGHPAPPPQGPSYPQAGPGYPTYPPAYGYPSQPYHQGGGRTPSGVASTAQLASFEVDELPEAYRLTSGSSTPSWLLPVAGIGVLAICAALATFYLLKPDASSAARTATVTVVSSPEGARVKVNGQVLSERTPTTFSGAELGKAYAFVVQLEGYKPWERQETFDTPNPKLIARLDRILVTLTVTSDPPGAEIYLNGSKSAAGRTPKTFTEITPETAAQIEIRKPGYRTVERKVLWGNEFKKEEAFLLAPSR